MHFIHYRSFSLRKNSTGSSDHSGVSASSESPKDIIAIDTGSSQKSTPETIDLTQIVCKTPPSKLQEVYDLSQESSQATYDWLRLVRCSANILLLFFIVQFVCMQVCETGHFEKGFRDRKCTSTACAFQRHSDDQYSWSAIDITETAEGDGCLRKSCSQATRGEWYVQ